ncbi:MAG: DUF3025 domain-containing protein [Rhodanobacter sp.]|nr:MAG: DUF3025 domain-containing protein [Rhodanobacter sp.]
MRYHAPAREAVDPAVFDRLPLADWGDYAALLGGAAWPSIVQLNQRLPAGTAYRFVAQTPGLLADGLHYELRIAERGEIATREGNWHDLFNALIWLRHPALKQALNHRQVSEIAHMGPSQRSRAQYALTQFDEGGVIVLVRDPGLLALWDAHDWHELFWRQRQAWIDGRLQLLLFGHALLELALNPAKLLVGKALVFQSPRATIADGLAHALKAIASGGLLNDPLELRPLPLAGIPGWHVDNGHEVFHRTTVCYQPKRAGREYPPASRC